MFTTEWFYDIGSFFFFNDLMIFLQFSKFTKTLLHFIVQRVLEWVQTLDFYPIVDAFNSLKI